MNEHSEDKPDWRELRERIVGLGKESIRKSYYPELQQRMQELEESRERYRQLVEDASDVIMETDKEPRFSYLSPRIYDLLGYRPEELLGHTPYEFMPLEEGARVERELKPILESRRLVDQFEHVFAKKDGSLVTVEVTAQPVYAPNGEYVGYRGIMRDVTSRKAAEEALRKSERRLSDIVDFLPDPTFVIDIEGRVTVWNKAIEKMTGVRAEKIIGKGNYEYGLAIYGERRPMIVDLVAGSTPDQQQKYLHFDREDGSVVAEAHTPILRPGGAYIWGKASLLCDPDGNVIGSIESLRDVTDRRMAEQALMDSEEKFRALAENAESIIFISRESAYLYTNPYFSRLTGFSGDELRAMDPLSIVHPDFRDVARREWEKKFSGVSSATHLEFKMVGRHKNDIWIDYFGARIEYQGSTAVVGVGYDITQRKQVDEEKRAFYRETILSATDGKLDILDREDIGNYIVTALFSERIQRASELSIARMRITDFCTVHHLDGKDLDSFILGVGEAIDNALKHAGSGLVYAGADQGHVWVGVSDEGPGIGSLILPKAVLRRGFSTKPSLGLGYSIMLEVADHILLETGRSGTVVVLIKSLKEEGQADLESIPDTWEAVGRFAEVCI